MQEDRQRQDQAPGFLRELHPERNRTRIRSTCKYCGEKLVHSVPELLDLEWQHRRACKKPRNPSTEN